MRIVIVGDGKVGFTLTEQLAREGHDVVVIDNNPTALRRSLDTLDVQVMAGNGALPEVQRKAEVGRSDLMIAATSLDEVNLLCCVVAKKLGCQQTIARVRNPDYNRQIGFLHDELGLSMTVNPEFAAAGEIFGLLQYPEFLKRDSFARGRVELVELQITEGSPLAGKTLMQIGDVIKVKALVCAVDRDGEVTIPGGGFMLCAGDSVTLTARRSDLAAIVKNLGLQTNKIRGAMLIGGGRAAAYLAGDLIRSGVLVKIVEKDRGRCNELSEHLPDAIIINGDGSDQELLYAEGIKETDAVVTMTGMDEENLIISMFADHIGVPKVVTVISRIDYAGVFRTKGISSVISPKLIAAERIVRYVRAMGNTTGGSVITLHRIVDEKVEALEFLAGKGTAHLGVPLAKLPIRKNTLIACISRGADVITPKGSDCIFLGDTVVVVSEANNTINSLNDIFKDD